MVRWTRARRARDAPAPKSGHLYRAGVVAVVTALALLASSSRSTIVNFLMPFDLHPRVRTTWQRLVSTMPLPSRPAPGAAWGLRSGVTSLSSGPRVPYWPPYDELADGVWGAPGAALNATVPDANVALLPELSDPRRRHPPSFAFDPRVSAHGRALAVGMYLIPQRRNASYSRADPIALEYLPAACELRSPWLESVAALGLPAVLLHNCLDAGQLEELVALAPRVIASRVFPREPVVGAASAAERSVGAAADWLRSADVRVDRLLISLDADAALPADDPFAAMAARPEEDLLWSGHPLTRAFEKLYWTCLDGEEMPDALALAAPTQIIDGREDRGDGAAGAAKRSDPGAGLEADGRTTLAAEPTADDAVRVEGDGSPVFSRSALALIASHFGGDAEEAEGAEAAEAAEGGPGRRRSRRLMQRGVVEEADAIAGDRQRRRRETKGADGAEDQAAATALAGRPDEPLAGTQATQAATDPEKHTAGNVEAQAATASSTGAQTSTTSSAGAQASTTSSAGAQASTASSAGAQASTASSSASPSASSAAPTPLAPRERHGQRASLVSWRRGSLVRPGIDMIGGDPLAVSRTLDVTRLVLRTIPSPRSVDCSQPAAAWVAARSLESADHAAALKLLRDRTKNANKH